MSSMLITVVIVLVVVGFVLWLINAFIPMASPIKGLLNLIVIVALVLWILQVFGIFNISQFTHLLHTK